MKKIDGRRNNTRPKTGKAREELIRIRVSLDEKRAIEDYSLSLGLTTSELIRESLLARIATTD